MKPEEHRKRSIQSGMARGRMFLKADLSWLSGFPVKNEVGFIDWTVIQAGSTENIRIVRLDREAIRRATETWTKLALRFPRALPRIVDDVECWKRGVPQLLEWLKGAIHEGRPLPTSPLAISGSYPTSLMRRSRKLFDSHPTLQPLLEALAWRYFLSPQRFEEALKHVESFAISYETILRHSSAQGMMLGTRDQASTFNKMENPEIIPILLLESMAATDGAHRFTLLMHYLSDERAYHIEMDGAHDRVDELRVALTQFRRTETITIPDEKPLTKLGPELLSWLSWLHQKESGERRLALQLLATSLPDDRLDAWQSWWELEDGKLKQARRHLLNSSRYYQPDRKNSGPHIRHLIQLQKQMPSEPQTRRLQNTIGIIVTRATREFCNELQRLLNELPQSYKRRLVRPAFLCLAQWIVDDSAAPALFRELRQFFTRRGVTNETLAPWQGPIYNWRPDLFRGEHGDSGPLCELLDIKRRYWSVGLEALTLSPYLDPEFLLELVRVTGSAPEASTIGQAFADAGIRYGTDHLYAASQLTTETRSLIQMVLQFQKMKRETSRAIGKLVEQPLDSQFKKILADEILDNISPMMKTLTHRSILLHQLNVSQDLKVPEDPISVPPWALSYPQEFHITLSALAAAGDEAQQTTAYIFEKINGRWSKLDRQLAALDQRLAAEPNNERLVRGRHNIQKQLLDGISLSPALCRKVKTRLNRARRAALVTRWNLEAEKLLRAPLRELLGITTLPDWLVTRRETHTLTAILQLKRPFRELGLDILKLRCESKPWTLKDHPANQRFLKSLRSKGIDPDPWLDPPKPVLLERTHGVKVQVLFENDPLEILQMGSCFDTCLSVGDFNFFSALANVVDVNKHVIIARDEQGHVLGRCLVALTAEGRILPFHVYCHDDKLGFKAMIRNTVDELASQMHTIVASSGDVPTLVATDWYDDGPEDLTNRFAFLLPQSDFYKSCESMSLDDFVPRLRSLFEPLPLNELTLPIALESLPFWDRPELMQPLISRLEKLGAYPTNTRILAAHLAYLAGRHGFARQVLESCSIQELRRYEPPIIEQIDNRVSTSIFEIVATYDPSKGLRLLRKSRRGGRADKDEKSRDSRAALLIAHEALGRTERAASLRIAWQWQE